MKVLIVLAAMLALAAAQYAGAYGGYYPAQGYNGYGAYGYRPNTASQTSNANSGAGGTSIASGTANAYGRDKRSAETRYVGYSYPGSGFYGYDGYAPNSANQVSNANSGAGGTSIASGTANANGRPLYREKRSPEPQYVGYQYPSYYGGYAPNSANQVSNANSGAGGTSIASGTANANQRPWKR